MLWEYITPSMEASVRFWPIAAYHLLKLNVRFQYEADIHKFTQFGGVS